jgi:hypothetical protein
MLVALLVAALPSAAQERRWVTSDRAMLREPDPNLDTFCKETIPGEAANGLRAPSTLQEFRPWLERLKKEKPAVAKCYDPGTPIRPGTTATILDSDTGCGITFRRVRLADGRVGCVSEEYLGTKPPAFH